MTEQLGLSPLGLAELQAAKAVIACQQCGRPVQLKREHGRFCSDNCRLVAWVYARQAQEHALTHPGEAIATPIGATGIVIVCGPRKRPDLQAEFLAWLDTTEGQAVYVEVLRRALILRGDGAKHGSVKDIYADIRRVYPDRDLNDRWTSRLARLLMEREFALVGFFETRALRAR